MGGTLRILLAEDNPGDVRLFREALDSIGLSFELILAEDGEKAIALAKSSAPNQPLDLVVLDINLPRHKGDEVLRQLRAEPSFRDTPVIVMTSSEAPADRAAAEWFGASRYIRKPSDLDELIEVARMIEKLLKQSSS
ncbi:MAG TPA: response regulator [Bryobacteraceae bacterium]|nr:response regulator [Bryobacteraceae bacterium]